MPKKTNSLLNDLFIRPDFDKSRILVTFTKPEGLSRGKWAVQRSGKTAARGAVALKRTSGIKIQIDLPGFISWSVSNPFLYSLVLKLTVKGKTVDVRQKFGMFKAEARGTGFYYNNRPFYLKGVIRGREAHDHPNFKGLGEKNFYAEYIKQAKRYGFNFIRFHSRIPPEAYFKAADELGMLTQVEIRKYYGKYQKERQILDDLDDKNPELVDPGEWKKAVLKIRNHPSLLVYCMGNEIDSPGKNPGVKKIYDLTRQLDPCRLFLDTCGRGEYDRKNVDFDVKHMGYFVPFGSHYHMFDTTEHCGVFGSVKGIQTRTSSGTNSEKPDWKIQREIPVNFPIIAHEICHYAALRDINGLDEKFEKYSPDQKPWWVGELKKLIKEKGLEADYYSRMVESSKQYQYLWWKQGLESVRRSSILAGFHFFQLSDTERYENANGILDCFDEPTHSTPEMFLRFNGDAVLVADLPERCFFEEKRVSIPILLSHFDENLSGSAKFKWELRSAIKGCILMQGEMDDIDLDEMGSRRLCNLTLHLPKVDRPEETVFSCMLIQKRRSKPCVSNEWRLWLFPDRPQALNGDKVIYTLADVNPSRRYPQITPAMKIVTETLFITDRFSDNVISHLERGGDVLMLYRIKENRDKFSDLEEYYLPSTRDRFKGVIWDRGHMLGGFIRESPAIKDFPHQGYVDFQFSRLIDDADKVCLDDFPVKVDPIIQGNDKASRDRYDVHKFGMSELQTEYTLRKFAYLFEVMVGQGGLVVCGLNFKGIETDRPEVCALFESLVAYMKSDKFRPAAMIEPEALSGYLLEKGKRPRIKERMMTQYWQIDALPVESVKYWKDSEKWLREGKPY